MICYEFEDINETDCESDIAIHNMKCVNESLNLKMVISESMGWLTVNPTKNYADLEMEPVKAKF